MKKLCLCLTIFAALLFFAGCGGSKKENKNDEPDTGETVTDDDAVDTEPSGDTEPTDTEPADDSDTEPTEKPDEDGEKTPEELNKECQELGEESFYSEEDGTCLRVSICGERPDYTEWNQPPNPDDFAGLCYEYYENGSWPEEGYCDTVYSEEPGPCHFVCWEGTEWNADTNSCDIIDDNTSECRQAGGDSWDYEKSVCIRSKPCGERPGASEWNADPDHIGWCTEEYINGSWPDESYCDPVYSEKPGACHFICNEGFEWDEDTKSCDANVQTSECYQAGGEDYLGTLDYCFRVEKNCADKPAYSEWNLPQYGQAGKCFELYENGSWPAEGYCDTVYSEEPGACHFKCNSGFEWNAEKGRCNNDYLDCQEVGGTWNPERSVCTRSSVCVDNHEEYTVWNHDPHGTSGFCYEEYINGSWPEEGYCDPVYSEEPGACHYICANYAHRENSECVMNTKNGLL